MADNWDDSDDDWDKDDDEIDKKLGLLKVGDNAKATTATTATAIYDDDDDEDLTLKDKEMDEKLNAKLNKVKGSALANKKAVEMAAKEELELARKAMEMEAEMESNMSPEERRLAERAREEADARAMADDLFGGVDSGLGGGGPGGGTGQSMMAGDKVIMKDLKDHLRHAKKVGECITDHGKINLCAAFLKEVIQQCKDILDDDAITDIIKSCNVIKNEKVQQAKRKVKGQAQKSKKVDNAAIKKKMDKHNDTFGENDNYDEYDQLGGQYEDDFF